MGKEKKAKDAVKKPFYKKWWFWVIIIVVLAGIIGSGGGKDEGKGDTPPTTTAKQEESQTPEETKTDDVSADKFVEDVKAAIQGAISSKTESIQDVVLKDGDLCVYVDFSNEDPSPLTLEEIFPRRKLQIAIMNQDSLRPCGLGLFSIPLDLL
ncbi:MAG: hypothetical protein HFI57_14815 [Lachnospiraceae bacterium]|nr:hypothetical protein [Lachnospiraceae bacterium]